MITQFPGNDPKRDIPKPDFKVSVTPAGKWKERRINVAHIVAFSPSQEIDDSEKPEDAQAIIWISPVPVWDIEEDGKDVQFSTMYIKELPEDLADKVNGMPKQEFIDQQRGSVIGQRQQEAKAKLKEIDDQISLKEREETAAFDRVFNNHATPRRIAKQTATEIQLRISGSQDASILFAIYKAIHAKMNDEGEPQLKRGNRFLGKLSLFAGRAIWWISKKTRAGLAIQDWQTEKTIEHKIILSLKKQGSLKMRTLRSLKGHFWWTE